MHRPRLKYLLLSASISLYSGIVTSCSFFSKPPTPLKYIESLLTLKKRRNVGEDGDNYCRDTYFMSGSFTSSKFIVRKTTGARWAHITGGGSALVTKNKLLIISAEKRG